MDNKTLILISAAVAVVFFPQILAAAKGFLADAKPARRPSKSPPRSSVVGSDPSEWINDLYAIQKVLDANGQKEAASLISQAMVKIIGVPTNSGGRK